MTWWTSARAWRRAHSALSDALLALVIFGFGLLGQPNPQTGQAVPLTPPIVSLLAVACGALVARRRAPVAVWVATLVAAAVSIAVVAGPVPVIVTVMVALYTVATRCRTRTAVLAAVATPFALTGSHLMVSSVSWFGDATYTLAAASGMACAVGLAVKSNRAIVAAAEERARVAEQTREEEAQRRVTEERLRIARELHDVVAHHIAVVNVQSGVARHVLDSDPAAAAQALGHVRSASSVVLAELSTILGLLRTADDGPRTQPTPGLAQFDALVDSVRRSGTAVCVRTTGVPRGLAPGTDLAAYRIVQESLTNAGKHGTGSAEIAVEFRDDMVVIDVVNPIPAGPAPHRDAGGHGVVGMRERVVAVGGRLEAGARGDGRFVVHVELPAPQPAG